MDLYLRQGLPLLGLSTDLTAPLTHYADLLLEKNKVMNLTAITDPGDVATLHFLDCLALTKLVDFSGKSVVDVGTGAGFPGLPLRMAVPSMNLTLLDALNKRIDFLQSVCDDLGFDDVSCVHGRAEEFAPKHRASFDIAVSRAVANLSMLAEFSLPLVKEGGLFVAMKAVDSDQEIQHAKRGIAMLGGEIREILDYTIPTTNIQHRLVIIEKIAKTPEKYPRMFAKMKKNPL